MDYFIVGFLVVLAVAMTWGMIRSVDRWVR